MKNHKGEFTIHLQKIHTNGNWPLYKIIDVVGLDIVINSESNIILRIDPNLIEGDLVNIVISVKNPRTPLQKNMITERRYKIIFCEKE